MLTTEPQRAQVLDATGAPLTRLSPVYQLGVRPGRLRHPGVTAAGLAKVTGLAGLASQVLGQIQAAPSGAFLELVTLRPAAYDRLSRRLGKIPGLIVRQARMRLFDSSAPAIAGSVGTETARILRQDGVPYRPGSTVGLSGLQQAYQARLAGTPTTEIVVQNAATGRQVAVLQRWPGSPGSTVRTTIDPVAQDAADGVLGSARYSAAIVAIRPGSGQILAVAEHQAAGLPAVSPLSGHYQPGQAFTIISTAALLQAGFSPSTRTPCNASNRVGGVNFLNVPGRAEPRPAATVQHGFRARLRDRVRRRLAEPDRPGAGAGSGRLRHRGALAPDGQPGCLSRQHQARGGVRPAGRGLDRHRLGAGQPAGHGAGRRGGPVR